MAAVSGSRSDAISSCEPALGLCTQDPRTDGDRKDAGRYAALCTRDARFDGQFFTGVSSTGIYCRPVCAVRTPMQQNCRFFDLAAQAEHAGFRPCLRCRPELAPAALVWSSQDATGILLAQALRFMSIGATRFADEHLAPALLHAPGTAPVAHVAKRLGVSDRHLRRIFESHLGITPLQYLQTQRLLTAKHLLTDTRMAVTDVALASGFGSVRRFNAAFAAQYRFSPTQLRRGPATRATSRSAGSSSAADPVRVRLPYRPPLDDAALLGFFALRQVAGLDMVDPVVSPGARNKSPIYRRTLSLPPGRTGDAPLHGWLAVQFQPERCEVHLQVSDLLAPRLAVVMYRVRALLDLDADPASINAVLHGDFPLGDGLRVAGAWDGFETAVRAVLGQQITVAAARTLACRLVERFGEPMETPWPQLSRLFPTAAALADAPADALGQLGIVRQRQSAIAALARAVVSGQLQLHPGADVARTVDQLRALPGIGDWTAQYIAMRALRWPDAFPAGDVALQTALGVRQPGLSPLKTARAAEMASLAWKPWRSYAVVRAWARGSTQ